MKPLNVRIYGEVLKPRPQKKDPSKMTKARHWQLALLGVGRVVYADKNVIYAYAFGALRPSAFDTHGYVLSWGYKKGHIVEGARHSTIRISPNDLPIIRKARLAK